MARPPAASTSSAATQAPSSPAPKMTQPLPPQTLYTPDRSPAAKGSRQPQSHHHHQHQHQQQGPATPSAQGHHAPQPQTPGPQLLPKVMKGKVKLMDEACKLSLDGLMEVSNFLACLSSSRRLILACLRSFSVIKPTFLWSACLESRE